MAFLLGSLYTHIVTRCHVDQNNCTDCDRENEDLQRAFEMEMMTARLALFSCITEAASSQQVHFILTTVKIALAELQKIVTEKFEQKLLMETTARLYCNAMQSFAVLTNHLEESFNINTSPVPSGNCRKDQGTGHQKWLTNLTVAQLACFLRLMVDTGILSDPGNITRLSESVAGTVCTRKNTPVSAESLRIKFYTHDAATINMVREYLQNMMHFLRNYAY